MSKKDINQNNPMAAEASKTLVPLMEEIQNNHLGCIKPCKSWDKLPTPTGEFARFLPSTVLPANILN